MMNSSVQSKHKESKKSSKARFGSNLHESLSGTAAQYARQYLLPIEAEGGSLPLLVSPSQYPEQVCVRHLHKVVDVSSATLATGFTAAMSPDLYSPGFISSAAAQTLPSLPGIVTVEGDLYLGPTTSSPNITTPSKMRVYDETGQEFWMLNKMIADGAASSKLGFSLIPGGATQLTFYRVNKGDKPIQVQLWYLNAANTWVMLMGLVSGPTEAQSNNFDIPINASAIGFAFPKVGHNGDVLHVEITFATAQVSAAGPEALPIAFSQFLIDSNVRYGRVISMSLLATNTSPEIANGGTVSAGRVPRSVLPYGDIAANMAPLPPNRRYNGAAADGAYVTWIPSQFDEYELDSISKKRIAYSDSEYILVDVRGWGGAATSSFRLQFDWIVEFYTPSQLFEKVLTPVWTQEWEVLFHLLQTAPAATCNPGHLDALKSLLRKGVHMGKEAYDFYGRNQAVIDIMGKALMAALV